MVDEGEEFLARLGAWARRRAEPRLWISLAGAGCALAVAGVVIISGDAQVGEDGLSDGSRLPGIVLCLAVAAVGYALLHWFAEAPAATAGVTAIALAVPPFFYFLTFDADGAPPWSAEAILALSAVVWLVSYVIGPARGRPLLLGAGLVAVVLLAFQFMEQPFSTGFEATFVDESPFTPEETFPGDEPFSGDESTTQGDEPDPTTLGIVSLVFGGAYLVAARLLDRRGFAGAATPFVAASLAAIPAGIAFLGDDLEAAGAGAAAIVAGLAVAWLGARSGRRASTVIGAGGVALGIVLITADAMEDSSPTSIGIALLVAGGSVALAAQLLHMQTGESPQMTPGPSVFGRPPPPTGMHAAWQPPGGHQPGPWQRPVPGPPPGAQPQTQPQPQPPPTSALPPPPPG
jgi:hypothetical protein